MSIGPYNQKNFSWNDVRLFTTYSMKGGYIKLSSPKHNHPHYELFLFEAGHGTVTSCGKAQTFTKNTVVIIPPGVEHEVESTDGYSISLMTVCFNYKKTPDYKAKDTEKLYSFFESLIPKNEVSVIKDSYFGKFARSFAAEYESNRALAEALIVNLLENLFLRVLRILDKRTAERIDVPIYSYMSSAITNEVILSKTVENYLKEPECTLSGLADRLNMCPRNTQKTLKKIFGMSFSEKLREVRLKSALVYLEDENLSLKDIAKLANYNQYASFRKAFIVQYGISPSTYRIKIKRGETPHTV